MWVQCIHAIQVSNVQKLMHPNLGAEIKGKTMGLQSMKSAKLIKECENKK